jgi:hypothetical protein
LIIGGTKEMQNQIGNNIQNYNLNQIPQMNQRVGNVQNVPVTNMNNVGNSNLNTQINNNFFSKNSITMLFNILAIVVLSFYSIYALLDVMSLSKIQYIIRNLLLDLSRGIFYAGVLLGIGQIYGKLHLK